MSPSVVASEKLLGQQDPLAASLGLKLSPPAAPFFASIKGELIAEHLQSTKKASI